MVNHSDIFDNVNDLPTFSSPAIEANIHKIPGISEHFLYFNDDIFLGQPIFPEDFISTKGYKLAVGKDCYNSDYKNGAVISQRMLLSEYNDSLKTVNKLLDKTFGRTRNGRKAPPHMPFLLNKTIVTNLHERFAIIQYIQKLLNQYIPIARAALLLELRKGRYAE